MKQEYFSFFRLKICFCLSDVENRWNWRQALLILCRWSTAETVLYTFLLLLMILGFGAMAFAISILNFPLAVLLHTSYWKCLHLSEIQL